jgi:hypothetical protein
MVMKFCGILVSVIMSWTFEVVIRLEHVYAEGAGWSICSAGRCKNPDFHAHARELRSYFAGRIGECIASYW